MRSKTTILLIVIGILIVGFCGWRLWGTIEERRATAAAWRTAHAPLMSTLDELAAKLSHAKNPDELLYEWQKNGFAPVPADVLAVTIRDENRKELWQPKRGDWNEASFGFTIHTPAADWVSYGRVHGTRGEVSVSQYWFWTSVEGRRLQLEIWVEDAR